MSDDFADRVADVAALADPLRRDLYRYVVAQEAPVSRDAAAEGAGVARHTAKFHLDRLVEHGLLEAVFRRLSGRRGPGAGRPTKLYQRSSKQLSVTVPERSYELAARLLARAIDDAAAQNMPLPAALDAVAAQAGARLADRMGPDAQAAFSGGDLVTAACEALRRSGYEPRRAEAVVTLSNCPFDALARDHTELVCRMNHALVEGMCLSLARRGGPRPAGSEVRAHLEPGAGRCCVLLRTS
jgi:predicted ArsR family transcriptional regulator